MREVIASAARQSRVITSIMVFVLWISSAWAGDIAPTPLETVARHGLSISIPEDESTTWEADIPLLTPDGNILHLLGPARMQALQDPAWMEVRADLAGATQPDCTAHLEVLVQAASRRPLAQKLKMNCLGHTIHNAFVHKSPSPKGEGWGEGEAP